MRSHFTYWRIGLFFPEARVVRQNRSHEDFLVSYKIGDDIELHYVLDGHGGGNRTNEELDSEHTALYLEKHLVHHLLHHLDGVSYKDKRKITEAIAKAFREIDQHLYSSGAKFGSTCSLALLLPETVVVANLGDSQIYGIKDKKVKFATTPHTAVAEERRIREAGGHVREKRLNGIYLPSRSFGDFSVKVNKGQYQFPAPMGIIPDVSFLPRKDYDFLLLMSDGIVDGLRSTEHLEELIRNTRRLEVIPNELAEVAARKNGNDDIACLLCQL